MSPEQNGYERLIKVKHFFIIHSDNGFIVKYLSMVVSFPFIAAGLQTSVPMKYECYQQKQKLLCSITSRVITHFIKILRKFVPESASI